MMANTRRNDAIVIGGGVNGLTCAAMLAKNGVRTLLLEQRAEVGGCAAESEIAPGFKVPTLSHSAGPLRGDVVEELQLYLHGLAFSDSPIDVSTLSPDGRPLAALIRNIQSAYETLERDFDERTDGKSTKLLTAKIKSLCASSTGKGTIG